MTAARAVTVGLPTVTIAHCVSTSESYISSSKPIFERFLSDFQKRADVSRWYISCYRPYSWIGRSVRTREKMICHETERATADLNIRMKSSRRGESNCAVTQARFLFFGVFFKNNFTNNDNRAWVTAQLDALCQNL